jgi:hypothetical protein
MDCFQQAGFTTAIFTDNQIELGRGLKTDMLQIA